MPDGVVWWFDDKTGEGRILHAGRTYAVREAEMEPPARVAGARVHFDLDAGAPGTATRVTFRPGTRVSRRQRRFGDLTGARRPDTKGPPNVAVDRPDVGRDLESHPGRVADAWATTLSEGRLDDAMLLVAPDAVLHAEGEVSAGIASIRSYWSRSPLLGGSKPTIHGLPGADGDRFAVRWPGSGTADAEETLLSVAHGQIRELRHGAVSAVVAEDPWQLPVDISTEGEVSTEDRSRAVKTIGSVASTSGDHVLHASIRLRQAGDPALAEPAKARATIDLDGEPLRAHASGVTMTEAIDRLDERLRDRMTHVANHRRAIRRRGPSGTSGAWRHGDRPAQRPSSYPRPVEEREIVRHKTASPVDATLDEAVFDLEAMDHDFLLFRDLATGQDAVVARTAGGTYTVQYVDGPLESSTDPGTVAALDVDRRPPPEVSVRDAREHLDQTNEPWLFFRNVESGRGHVLYRRYDGHYGLVEPPAVR